MKKKKGFWTKKNCLIELKKYNSRSEFKKKSSGAWCAANKNNWLDDLYNVVELDNNIRWHQKDIELLKKNLPKYGVEYCVKRLNRTKKSIYAKATLLNINTKKINSYSDNEIKFLIENYGVKGGEYCAKKLNRTKKSIYKKAFELNLKVNNSVKYQNISNKRKFNNYMKYNVDSIVQVNSKFSSYILGYLWADGHIRKDRTHLTTINLIEEDAIFLYKILSNISNCWNIGNSFEKYWTDKFGNIKKGKNQRTIISYSQELFNFLFENDYGSKSNKSFKKIWKIIPDEFKSFFILGLYDGDGNFNYQYRKNKYHSGEFIITSSYKYDWSTLEKFCTQNNIEYKIYNLIVPLGKISKFVIRKKDSLLKLYNLLYSDEFNGLYRKKIKFDKYINEEP